MMWNSTFWSAETPNDAKFAVEKEFHSTMDEDCCEYGEDHSSHEKGCCSNDQGQQGCNNSDCNGMICSSAGTPLFFLIQNSGFAIYLYPVHHRDWGNLKSYSSIDINAIWDPPRMFS